jgi:hypothetical protein
LKDLPTTYLTSFYLAPGHDRQIVELSRSLPGDHDSSASKRCSNSCAAFSIK